jgi:hypothetical protein
MKIPTLEEMDEAIEGLLELFQGDDEDIEKANKYHDVAGRFTSADNAVAPKGKKPKLKRKATKKVLSGEKTLVELGKTGNEWSPRGLVSAGIISEKDLAEVWDDLIDSQTKLRDDGTYYLGDVQDLVDSKKFDEAWVTLPDVERGKFYKKLVVQTVGRAIDAKFTPEELAFARYGKPTSSFQLKSSGELAVNSALLGWAESSGSEESIALGEEARKVLGAEGRLAGRYEDGVATEYNLDSKRQTVLQKKINEEIVKTVYANTQKYLQSLGITDIDLVRGTGVEAVITGTRWDAEKDRLVSTGRSEVVQRPISSWSLDSFTAESFATEFSEGRESVVVRTTLPIERIFSTPLTGLGCLFESEFVVLAPPDGNIEVEVRQVA